LHIQSIADVELFGINTANYGHFILDRETWEQRYGFSVGNLRVGPLAAGESYAWSLSDQASYARLLENLENAESTALFRANQANQSVSGVLQQLADCERQGLREFDVNRSAASALRTTEACIDYISPRGRVPDKPSGLQLVTIATSQLRLTWDDVPSATGFRIYGGPEGSPSTAFVTSVGAHQTSYDIPTRAGGLPYCFWVSAFNPVGDSGTAGPACNTSPLPPPAPTNLRISESGTAFRLDWTATSTLQTGFRIVRNGQSVASVGSDTTTYLDFSWDRTVPNCYRVVAFNSAGEAASVQACPGENPPSAPSPPINLRVTPLLGGNGVRLDWTNTSTSEEGIRVLRGNQVIATVGPGSTSYVDPIAASGADCYQVVAYNGAGQGHSNETCLG
jgi:hypothetical protein